MRVSDHVLKYKERKISRAKEQERERERERWERERKTNLTKKKQINEMKIEKNGIKIE